MADRSSKRTEGVTPLKQSPFAGLAAAKAALTPDPAAEAAPVPAAPAPAAAKTKPSGPARAVVRIERKGRGGKDVTIVEQLDLSPALLERWLKELKQSLGTGGTIEDGALVVQGDHRERAGKWLEGRGVKKVTVAR